MGNYGNNFPFLYTRLCIIMRARALCEKLNKVFFKLYLTFTVDYGSIIVRKEKGKMALDKAILYNKEWRKPYRGAKSIDRSCCNHGTCVYCQMNRQYKNIKRLNSMLDKINEI